VVSYDNVEGSRLVGSDKPVRDNWRQRPLSAVRDRPGRLCQQLTATQWRQARHTDDTRNLDERWTPPHFTNNARTVLWTRRLTHKHDR